MSLFSDLFPAEGRIQELIGPGSAERWVYWKSLTPEQVSWLTSNPFN